MARKLKNLEEYQKDVKGLGEGYELLEMFTPINDPNRTYFWIRCPVGHEYQIRRIGEIIKQGKRCRKCFHKRITHKYEDVKNEFTNNGDVLLTLEKDYRNTHQKISYLCKVCGRQHQTTVKEYRKGSRSCTRGFMRGKNSPTYNHNLSDEERGKRRGSRHDIWAKEVIEKGNYRCEKCDSKGTMNAHHIFPYKYFVNMRYDIDNGSTLCRNCHFAFHGWFGREHEEPYEIDWKGVHEYFINDYEIPPKPRKRRMKALDYDESFKYCPQRIIQVGESLYTTIPDVKGYLVSEGGEVIGKRGKKLVRGRTNTFLAYDNNGIRVRLCRENISSKAFVLGVQRKDSLHGCVKYITESNMEVPKENAHRAV